MSQHPSLRVGRRAKRHRSVLKRYERLQALQEKETWKEGDSVFGLPKVKTIRIKVKKEKAAEAPVAATAAAGEAAPAAAAAPQAAEKGAAKAKAVEKSAPKEAAAPKKEPKKGK